MPTLPPVSRTLQAELLDFASGPVVWLDQRGEFTGFVDRWRASEPELPVLAWRGSFLELMLALGAHDKGSEPRPLLVHMPGFTEESLERTPVYPLRKAGKVFRRALTTLVEEAAAGLVARSEVASFLEREGLTLEGADAWLADQLAGGATGLRGELARLPLDALVGPLLENRAPVGEGRTLDEDLRVALVEVLETRLGMDQAFRDFAGLRIKDRRIVGGPVELGMALAGWALCVEFVDDLQRAPRHPALTGLVGLPKALVKECRRVAETLRRARPEDYARVSDEYGSKLAVEFRSETAAEDLGRIDTFEQEDERVFDAALAELRSARPDWARVAALAADRTPERSFWLARSTLLADQWELVREAAALGEQLTEHQDFLGPIKSLDEGLRRYTAGAWQVDAAHRSLEQRRRVLLDRRLPRFVELRDALNALRGRVRAWLDAACASFIGLCERDGFLPRDELRQRELFERHVRPGVEALAGSGAGKSEGRVAFLLVDGLRYEMGARLHAALGEDLGIRSRDLTLDAALAELPSLTAVGMNALAPVARDGRLESAGATEFKGFRCGSYTVHNPETRVRAMQDRVGGRTCPSWTLAEVLERDLTWLRKSAKDARLVVIHSEEIDAAGEKGAGLTTYEAVLRDLRSAVRILLDAGFTHIVLSADHGFLIQDSTTLEKIPFGNCHTPKRRHALAGGSLRSEYLVSVSPQELQMDGFEDHIVFARRTAVFDRGAQHDSYVHGGATIQERVIPIITIRRDAPIGDELVPWRVELGEAEADAGRGRHRLTLTLRPADEGLLFHGSEVELALRVARADRRPEGPAIALGEVTGGERQGASFIARPNEALTVDFRLSGPESCVPRVRVEVYHPSRRAEVEAAVTERRFGVELERPVKPVEETRTPTRAEPAPSASPVAAGLEWLEDLPGEGERKVFRHLAEYGRVTEAEAITMLGGARQHRKFVRRFDSYRELAPFVVRVEVQGGKKSYLRV